VIGITGAIPPTGATPSTGTIALFVSRAGAPLPVAAPYRFSNGGGAQVAFTDWGEHLAFTPPPNVIDASTLRP
jgi:hypothetical protein